MKILLLVWLVAAATPAGAHARLKSSDPGEGSILSVPPRSVTLTFSEAAKITLLTIQASADASPRKVAVSTGEDAIGHTVALPPLAPDDYMLTWRALSDDGHVTSGTIRFSVRAGSPGQS